MTKRKWPVGATTKIRQKGSCISLFQPRVRLANCIAVGDAHAMDAKYDKGCWRKYVFYILRKEESLIKENEKYGHHLQIATFVELVNIIDVQTRSGAQLSMADIENTYLNYG